jgi:hypothetical protein
MHPGRQQQRGVGMAGKVVKANDREARFFDDLLIMAD